MHTLRNRASQKAVVCKICGCKVIEPEYCRLYLMTKRLSFSPACQKSEQNKTFEDHGISLCTYIRWKIKLQIYVN